MNNIPRNYGYMEKGKKIFGRAPPAENDACVRVVDRDQHHSHHWAQHGHCVWKLNREEPDAEGWIVAGKQRTVIEKIKMVPCPNELENSGECCHRQDPEHKKFYYHFSRIDDDVVARDARGRPYCRYYANGNGSKCWEIHSKEHMEFYAHK